MEKEPQLPSCNQEQLPDDQRYDYESGQYPYVVTYQDMSYDLRVINRDGNCVYRMTSEARETIEFPNYIEIDKKGFVVRSWN